MAEPYDFGTEPITCFSWNKERKYIAVSLNNNEVQIGSINNSKLEIVDTLSEHVQRVTGIDWAPKTNRIVTCAADRNAYVWVEQQDHKWKPTLVLLRINRAATSVKWSPEENKFAVGSGAHILSVCYFEKDNDWWVSKHIKKPIKSTVTSIDWHPNNVLVGCGSTDFKARIFSAYVKEVDSKPEVTKWGEKMSFGTVLAEFSSSSGGWVHSVSFSSSGDQLAFVAHDSSINVIDAARGTQLATLKTSFLPFVTCLWLSDSTIIAAGHDCIPIVFEYDGKLNAVGKFTDAKQAKDIKFSAKKHFQSLDSRNAAAEETGRNSMHQNTITQLSVHSGTKANCNKFTSAGVDGQLIIWDLKQLESAMESLRIK